MRIEDRLTPRNHWTGRDGHRVAAVVLHITDGDSADSAVGWFHDARSGVSAHYVYDGARRVAYRVVSEGDTAWANGLINRPNIGLAAVRRWVQQGINPNLETVSIEKTGRPARGWTAVELEDVRGLVRDICARHGLTPGPETVIGHKDIDSVNRARCPSLTPEQWAFMWGSEMATPDAADAAFDAYATLHPELGQKRLPGAGTLKRAWAGTKVMGYERGFLAYVDGGVVDITARMLDDAVTYMEQDGSLGRYT